MNRSAPKIIHKSGFGFGRVLVNVEVDLLPQLWIKNNNECFDGAQRTSFFGYPEEGSPETLDDFPFVPRGNLRRERKKTYFFNGNLHLDDQSRVALVLQLSVSQTVWFDASALSCLFGARWKENLFVGLVGFEMRPRFCAPIPNLQIRWCDRF